jgi:putative transposase
VSERRAYRGIGVSRMSVRYTSVREEPMQLVEMLRELAKEGPRFGCRGLYRLLRRRGHPAPPWLGFSTSSR